MLRGIVAFFALIIAIAIHSAIVKGSELTELLEDFSTRGYILKNCYMVSEVETLLRLSFIRSMVFHYVEIDDEIIVACPANIYMLINRERTGKLINCFCLEKMT